MSSMRRVDSIRYVPTKLSHGYATRRRLLILIGCFKLKKWEYQNPPGNRPEFESRSTSFDQRITAKQKRLSQGSSRCLLCHRNPQPPHHASQYCHKDDRMRYIPPPDRHLPSLEQSVEIEIPLCSGSAFGIAGKRERRPRNHDQLQTAMSGAPNDAPRHYPMVRYALKFLFLVMNIYLTRRSLYQSLGRAYGVRTYPTLNRQMRYGR